MGLSLVQAESLKFASDEILHSKSGLSSSGTDPPLCSLSFSDRGVWFGRLGLMLPITCGHMGSGVLTEGGIRRWG